MSHENTFIADVLLASTLIKGRKRKIKLTTLQFIPRSLGKSICLHIFSGENKLTEGYDVLPNEKLKSETTFELKWEKIEKDKFLMKMEKVREILIKLEGKWEILREVREHLRNYWWKVKIGTNSTVRNDLGPYSPFPHVSQGYVLTNIFIILIILTYVLGHVQWIPKRKMCLNAIKV